MPRRGVFEMTVFSSFSVIGRLYERGSVEGGSNDIGTFSAWVL